MPTDETPATEEARFAAEIEFFARKLVDLDLLEWFGGNISVRVGEDDLLINRTRAAGTELGAMPVVRTGIHRDDANTPWASSALAIHRAIYRTTSARAIIHAHPRNAVLLSFFEDEIMPIDENGLLYLGLKGAKVVAAPEIFGWNLVADDLANALDGRKAVVLRWHGSFAIGQTLDDALHATRGLDNAAEYILRFRQAAPHFGPAKHLPAKVASIMGGDPTRLLPPGS
ncbi:MAG: class II aldolase/adducin family protein [Chloroflexota bacterium]